MEVKQINQLMLAMGRYGIKTLSLKKEGFELSLERTRSPLEKAFESSLEEFSENPLCSDFARKKASVVQNEHLLDQEEKRAESAAKEDSSDTHIESPMVGTVYLSPSPGEASYVKVGDSVREDTIVCLVEAMKVMNEVRSGISGVVAEVLVDNGQPVEFSSKLFRIIPK